VPENTFIDTILSLPVLLTFIVCALVASIIIWFINGVHRRQRERLLADQRVHQEATLQRLLDTVVKDKDEVVAEYEQRLRERDERVATLEREVARLRDRLSSSGLMGLFGGRQRDVVSALLLENEQLHELLAKKQEQMRDMMADMTTKLMDRIDEQAQESARAVRYKQALLSAFLQHEETRRLLDSMIAEGKLAEPKLPEGPAEASPR
jgi:hypothetical protein